MTICANYPEFEGFSEFLQKQVLPAYTILSSFPKEDDKSEVIITR
jgi:hypothetical protein